MMHKHLPGIIAQVDGSQILESKTNRLFLLKTDAFYDYQKECYSSYQLICHMIGFEIFVH